MLGTDSNIRCIAFLVFIACGLSACHYRFSNEAIVLPDGIESLAVDTVYDTAREVIPHEHLWRGLQKAIVRDGTFRLVKPESADGLLRVHIYEGATLAGGKQHSFAGDQDKDPRVFDKEPPNRPQEFRTLTQAATYASEGLLRFAYKVDLYNLKTGKLLKTIKGVKSVSAQSLFTKVTTRSNDFLRHDEALESKFRLQAELIGAAIVKQILRS